MTTDVTPAGRPTAMPQTTPADVYRLFFRPGEVVEVRALGCSGKNAAWAGFAGGEAGVFGYFDNAADLTRAVEALKAVPADRAPGGIYFTPNPPLPSLIARAQNRLVAGSKKRSATHDGEISAVRWLLVDLDISKTLKPAGISATDAELKIAADAARDLLAWTAGLGFCDPIKGFSGNGYHLVWRIQTLPASQETSGRDGLLHRCLQALDARMREIEPYVDVDLKVYNASRIWKFYGTVARKGDHTQERPHRVSRLLWAPAATYDELPKLPLELLEALAAKAASGGASAASTAPAPAAAGKPNPTRRLENDLGPLILGDYLDHYGVAVKDVQQKGDATWHRLEHCLFDGGHTFPDAAVVQNDSGTIWYHCSHNSCSAYKWKDARDRVSGKDKIARFCQNYQERPTRRGKSGGKSGEEDDGAWQASRPAGSGLLHDIAVVPNQPVAERPDGLPTPEKIHPQEFFAVKGKRERFVVRYAVNYLAAWFAPIVWTEGMFYHYRGGVWRELNSMVLRQTLIQALKDRVQANWLTEATLVLSGLVNREEDDWPQYPSLINVENGMIDMDRVVAGDLEGALIPHDPRYGSRVQLPVRYDPDAEYPQWMTFLDQIFPEVDAGGYLVRDKHVLMQQYCGYVLLPTCKYERCLFCFGTGANGKSTFLNVFEKVIGKDNTVNISIEALSNRFNVPYLRGKMLNVASEVETKEPAGTQIFKQCVSGDLVMGELKYGERVKFRNTAKFIFAMNNPPSISDRSWGFQRKVLVVNFNRRFEEDEMDRDLYDRLVLEKEGIFLWSLIGAAMLVSQGTFRVPEEIADDQRNFMATVNPLLLFVDECCELGDDEDLYRVESSVVYKKYCTWIDQGRQKALGRNNFYSTLLGNYPRVRKVRAYFTDPDSRQVGFTGIRLRDF